MVDEQQQAGTGPEETGPSTPVPVGVKQHARHEHVVDDASHVVKVASQHNGLDLKTGRRDICNKSVADRANSKVVDEGVDHEQSASSQRRAAGCSEHAHSAD